MGRQNQVLATGPIYSIRNSMAQPSAQVKSFALACSHCLGYLVGMTADDNDMTAIHQHGLG
ncbi:MAG: hypothetical protein KKC01_02185 [Gammaproteobacteria bacterium]|nr:hypothetical protein [Gammaproteobacteria bacterium]